MIDPTVLAKLKVSDEAFRDALEAEYAPDLPLSVRFDLFNAAVDAAVDSAAVFTSDSNPSVVETLYRVLAPSFKGTYETGRVLGSVLGP